MASKNISLETLISDIIKLMKEEKAKTSGPDESLISFANKLGTAIDRYFNGTKTIDKEEEAVGYIPKLSAYDKALMEGFEGTEQQWILSLLPISSLEAVIHPAPLQFQPYTNVLAVFYNKVPLLPTQWSMNTITGMLTLDPLIELVEFDEILILISK